MFRAKARFSYRRDITGYSKAWTSSFLITLKGLPSKSSRWYIQVQFFVFKLRDFIFVISITVLWCFKRHSGQFQISGLLDSGNRLDSEGFRAQKLKLAIFDDKFFYSPLLNPKDRKPKIDLKAFEYIQRVFLTSNMTSLGLKTKQLGLNITMSDK